MMQRAQSLRHDSIDDCRKCKDGYIANSQGTEQCAPCPKGTFSKDGESCGLCETGKYSKRSTPDRRTYVSIGNVQCDALERVGEENDRSDKGPITDHLSYEYDVLVGEEFDSSSRVRVLNLCDNVEVDYEENLCTGTYISAEEIVRQRCYELGPNCKGYQKKQGYAGTFYSYSTDSSDPTFINSWSYEELHVNAKDILKLFSHTLADALIDCSGTFKFFCNSYGISTQGEVYNNTGHVATADSNFFTVPFVTETAAETMFKGFECTSMEDCALQCSNLDSCEGFTPAKYYEQVRTERKVSLTESSYLIYDSEARFVITDDFMNVPQSFYPTDSIIEVDTDHTCGSDSSYKYYQEIQDDFSGLSQDGQQRTFCIYRNTLETSKTFLNQ